VADWRWECVTDELLDRLPPDAVRTVRQLAEELAVRESMAWIRPLRDPRTGPDAPQRPALECAVTVLDHRKDVHLSQARVARVEHGDVEKIQVEQVAAIGRALGPGCRLRPGHTTFIDSTDALTA
jgi:hypothetical protein